MPDEFGPLEEFFAKRMLRESHNEEHAYFLKKLMRQSRDGNLCLKVEGELARIGDSLPPLDAIVRNGDRYYLSKDWTLETSILKNVERLRKLKPAFSQPFSIVEGLLPEQAQAIKNGIENVFSIICGGPGTGKTYTAAALVRTLLSQTKLRVCLAAPTGKAASHLQSFLGPVFEATTLHRLLRLKPFENRLIGKKIDADLVLVDEASMIDVPLMAHLFEAIGEGTRLVLMGDPDQLPPATGASLFPELSRLFGTSLQKSMRTGETTLQTLNKAIQLGDSAQVQEKLQSNHHLLDWKFDEELPAKLYQVLQPFISWERPDPKTCLQSLDQFRVISALRQGPFGIDALNWQIVQIMAKKIRSGQWWAIPILITSNEPRLDLYNGTCGVLIGQCKAAIQNPKDDAFSGTPYKCKAALHLEDGIGYFPNDAVHKILPSYEISFCLSIHKSQGSEFNHVLALFPKGSENFGREALYTAATRSRKKLEIVAEDEVLARMISQPSARTSGFLDRWPKP